MRHLTACALALLLGAPGGASLAADPTPATAEPALESAGINGRFLLQNRYGEIVTDQDLHGSFPLITFGYTHCPDICPTTLAEMARVMELLGDKAERLQPVFITVDPERDNRHHLAEYVGWFHPRLMGLTGGEALVRRAADNFKVRYRKVHQPGDPPDRYAVDHSAGLFLMGPDGRFLEKFPYAADPTEIAKRIEGYLER